MKVLLLVILSLTVIESKATDWLASLEGNFTSQLSCIDFNTHEFKSLDLSLKLAKTENEGELSGVLNVDENFDVTLTFLPKINKYKLTLINESHPHKLFSKNKKNNLKFKPYGSENKDLEFTIYKKDNKLSLDYRHSSNHKGVACTGVFR